MNDIKVQRADSPYIFSLLHSGEVLTSEMEFQLTPEVYKILPNVDWYLNELYRFLVNYKVREFINRVYDVFKSEGFETIKNDVFIGGYISKHWDV